MQEYLRGWSALAALMNSGRSWSGHERNCCFINVGDGTFADVSAVTGLDFVDDGRALATTDWDQDGDLDIWLRNRTGPQLRLMRNDVATGTHFVQIKLEGKRCNRDAIGAVVEVRAGGRRLRRDVIAGDGYLAQSSTWLHFGLADADRIERVRIRWPGGGEQIVATLEIDRRYVIAQGGDPQPVAGRAPVSLPAGALQPPDEDSGRAIVLRVPCPMPPTITIMASTVQETPRPLLMVLWAQWCTPCLVELRELTADARKLSESGVDILALNVDRPEDRVKARRSWTKLVEGSPAAGVVSTRDAAQDDLSLLAAILTHVRGMESDQLPLPAALLIDEHGFLQVIYLGGVTGKTLLTHVGSLCAGSTKLAYRGQFPGRWFFRSRRDLRSLALDLRRRGLEEDYRFYVSLNAARKAFGRQ